ncbi:MAG TPA: D-alanyl-D-alanine carboxypeptidase/D-alanyl-D-alanine-endopeptidase, partial [Kineosporiaceae bacterium]|nr:D-alanyl-D-alanine carboxypeptidase/D-alanyl-D-alanine-endopeptidase [Kineosporiaceae bacterium]
TVTLTPASTAVSAPGATVPSATPDVLSAVPATAQVPTTAGLQKALAPLLGAAGLGAAVSVQVVDVQTGKALLSVNPAARPVPASTAKLLTAAAVLTTVGPQQTLPTTVVSGATPAEVVLVGGGDVLLGAGPGDPHAVAGRAGLADLADQVAAALQSSGRTSVAVRLDDGLFQGPAISPGWQPGDVAAGFVAPVMALEVNAGVIPKKPARQADPAMSAAQTFAALLGRRGIAVTGPVTRAGAPASASTLGTVRSAPVADLVEYALTMSDNTVAEALARLVAVKAGRPATFTDGGKAVLDQVGRLGVPVDGDHLVGGSGLADGSSVSVATLTGLLALAGSADHPQLRALLTGLPVAGASGTLSDRFAARDQHGGLGVVRAKTGTLKGVNALAGLVVDVDGRLLAFAILADKTGGTEAARAALDDVAVALAGCGCH